MAGDAHVPRRLSRAWLLLVAAVAACGTPAPPASDGSRPADAQPRAAPQSSRDRHDAALDDATLQAALDTAAWARLRWPEGRVLEAHRLDRLDEPVHAGSIFKVIAARAAIEQQADELGLVCPRRVETHGRRVDCVHVDLGRPLTIADAIAHSCNHFFVRLADRLDRGRLAETLRRLSDGQIGSVGDAPLPLVVLGLEGPRLGMRQWLRVASAAFVSRGDLAVGASLRRGLERAVSDGSASALLDVTTRTRAKTGTTARADGQQEGMVVAWRPERAEAIVVRAAGGAGRDAARLARAVWDRAAAAGERSVRVGRLRDRALAPRVDVVPLEAYVAGVVAAEGEGDLPAPALQALAVAARSYGAAPGRRHAREGYDVCDTTHCQVLGTATSWSREATLRTRGLVLSREGRIVAAPYSASCSGILVDPEEVWAGASVVRTAVGADPGVHAVATWTREVDAASLAAALRAAGFRGDLLRGLRVVGHSRRGLPARIALDGFAPAEIDATPFRHVVGRALGWDVMKSHAWQVTRTARGYRFSGRGKGHGAGLCVRGAAALATGGASVTEVVAAYVPTARIVALQDDVRVRVPGALTGDASALREEVRAVLAALRLRLAVTTPRAVEIRVHGTRAAYQRATGRAWWTSASTRPIGAGAYAIDVVLPDEPQDRALMAATLRHELVHVLTHAALADAPAWVAEGLAVAAAVEGHPRPGSVVERREGCPTDSEIGRPGGIDAMRDAYVRAAACVGRALPGGVQDWRRLGS